MSWRANRPFLTRTIARPIVAFALLAVIAGDVGVSTPRAAMEGSSDGSPTSEGIASAGSEALPGVVAGPEAASTALFNAWNGFVGEQSYGGQLLVSSYGKGEQATWTPSRNALPRQARHTYGVFGNVVLANPVGSGKFTYPTGESRVSGWYFHDRRNPTHIGLDYACKKGDPIYAADNGVVTIARWNGGYGIMVELDHHNGYRTRYGHFSELAVRRGHTVYKGDLLGYCGSTGLSSGSHLHFEIRHNGAPRNPMSFLPGALRRARAPTALRASGGESPREDKNWFAQFYNSEDLTGSPAVTYYEPWIGSDWGGTEPMPGVWADGFSVRWTRRLRLDTGHYRFCAMSDDGVRIWVGKTLVLDEWHANNGIAYCGEYQASAGIYAVRVEYYEHGGMALIYVWWESD